MNTLSWLIYLGGVVENLNIILIPICLILAILVLIQTIHYIGEEGDASNAFKSTYKTSSLMFIVVALLLVVTPSRQTLYLVAASEAAHVAVESEDGKQMMSMLRKKIFKALKTEDE